MSEFENDSLSDQEIVELLEELETSSLNRFAQVSGDEL